MHVMAAYEVIFIHKNARTSSNILQQYLWHRGQEEYLYIFAITRWNIPLYIHATYHTCDIKARVLKSLAFLRPHLSCKVIIDFDV